MPGDGHNLKGTQRLWNWLALAALLALGIVWAPEPPAAAAAARAGPLPAAAAHLAAAVSTRTR